MAKKTEDRGKGLKSNARTDRAIAAWKKLHLQHKVLEPQLEMARDVVTAVIQAADADFLESRYGTIALATKSYLDMTDLKARLVDGGFVKAEVLDALIVLATKDSKQFVAAPREWSAEVRRASEKKAA